jgi:CubicO group peptidase (beta-lactamase class C family)
MRTRKALPVLMSLSCVVLILFIFILPCSGNVVNYPNTVSTAREIIWKTIISGGGNSASVAVMDRGNIVYSEGFGPADRSLNRLVDRDTRFNIGSTSKMFAAVAILLLADDGKLSLEDPVVKHIPEFVMKDPRYRDITVRMLFNHSSGLPGSTFVFGYRADEDHQTLLLETLKNAVLKHTPGEMSIYCNDGFTLAEIIVERVSGKSFASFVTERIFSPLEMRNSGESVGVTGGKIAEFYDEEGNKYPPEVVTVLGAGGLSSTPEDLCRFGDSFAPGGMNILSDSSLKDVLKEQPTPFSSLLKGDALLDAFGWDYALLPAYRENGYQVLGKSGGTLFYSTNLQILPQERLAIAVTYSGQAGAAKATHRIMEALMKDKGLPGPKPVSPVKPPEPQPIPDEFLKLAGFYVNTQEAVRMIFDNESHTLNVYSLASPSEDEEAKENKEKPILSLVHNGGLFHDFATGYRYYFLTGEKTVYLVMEEVPQYGADIPMYQKIDPVEKPESLSVVMDGRFWLIRNASTFAQLPDDLLVKSEEYGDLPGYVKFFGVNRVETPDFGAIAATGFRDQCNIQLFKKDGAIRLKAIQFVYSSEDIAGTLVPGENTIVIGSEGENEWRKVEQGGIMSIEKPANGRVIIFPRRQVEKVYDSIIDSSEISVPGGSLVFLAGEPGDSFSIIVR